MPSPLLAAASSLFLAGAYLSFGEAARARAGRLLAGSQGEDRVGVALDEAGGMDRLDGFLVESRQGRTALIDHAIRGRSRLLVVETKTWSGVVHGGVRDRDWRQIRPGGQVKVHRNPIMQARRQAKILAEISGAPVASLVVMAGRCRAGAGGFPEGVVPLGALPRTLPGLLHGRHPVGDLGEALLSDAWGRVVEQAHDPVLQGRAGREASDREARFGRREWLGWTAMAIAAGAAALASAPGGIGGV